MPARSFSGVGIAPAERFTVLKPRVTQRRRGLKAHAAMLVAHPTQEKTQ
jgi:hypothetical protein